MRNDAANDRRRPAVVVSIAAHAALLTLLIAPLGLRVKTRTLPPATRCCFTLLETAGGSHTPVMPVPGVPGMQTTLRPNHDLVLEKKRIDPVHPAKAAKAAAPPPPSQSTGTGTGAAATGSGSDNQNATPAFPVFSPKPPVNDRALLPSAEQQIVVDVNVSAAGEVTAESLVKGMGTPLDQIVLDTVKTWKFHPATVNGNPIASEAELIFPFNRSYPVSGA
jgi:TonB family protein